MATKKVLRAGMAALLISCLSPGGHLPGASIFPVSAHYVTAAQVVGAYDYLSHQTDLAPDLETRVEDVRDRLEATGGTNFIWIVSASFREAKAGGWSEDRLVATLDAMDISADRVVDILHQAGAGTRSLSQEEATEAVREVLPASSRNDWFLRAMVDIVQVENESLQMAWALDDTFGQERDRITDAGRNIATSSPVMVAAQRLGFMDFRSSDPDGAVERPFQDIVPLLLVEAPGSGKVNASGRSPEKFGVMPTEPQSSDLASGDLPDWAGDSQAEVVWGIGAGIPEEPASKPEPEAAPVAVLDWTSDLPKPAGRPAEIEALNAPPAVHVAGKGDQRPLQKPEEIAAFGLPGPAFPEIETITMETLK